VLFKAAFLVDPPIVLAAEWNKTRFAQTTFHFRAALNGRVPNYGINADPDYARFRRKQPPSLTLRAGYPLNEMGVKNKNVFEFPLRKRVFLFSP